MPPRRRASGPQSKSSQQSALAFHGQSNRVSKPGAAAAKGKATNKTKQDPIISESITKTNLKAEADPDLSEPTTSELAIAQQAQREAAVEQTPEERDASKITDAQIKKYWKEKERIRKVQRVHQGDLTLYEKVLREFDMSGQFGPAIGITRTKRWKRAQKLKLNPPTEVLAVLMKEQEADNTKAQRAHVDELMSSRFIET
ncbi:putative DNA polymerase delta subunit 4 [Saccharata proteae CBS 121410]|uniref:DNA polymerase delta subunit 4 n=1 Tax=Saccharata proteae CBS 121410 TaxID=1314787 RepID=A0A9P4LUY2_9PEZI|nr:putative DNA polymerase delta subunit 4 [Saccharata proteae CBS 121410]